MRHFLLASLVVAAVLGFVLPTSAQDRPRLKIGDVQVGFPSTGRGGACKVGAWAPVYLDITNEGTTRFGANDGTLVVETMDGQEVQNHFRTRLPTIEPNETRQVLAYVCLGKERAPVEIIVQDANGRALARRPVNQGVEPYEPRAALYLAVGGRPSGLGLALKPKQGGKDPDVPEGMEDDSGSLRPLAFADELRFLPTRWFGYQGVDVMILCTSRDGFVNDLLADGQNRKEALAEWVRRGGRLVVGVGRNHQAAGQLLARMGFNGCDIAGTVPRGALRGLGGWSQVRALQAELELPKLDVRRGVIHAEEPEESRDAKRRPLLVQTPYGRGSVLLAAFDVDQAPFAAWIGRPEFWRRLRGELEPKGLPEGPQHASPMPELGDRLITTLETFPDVPVISFGWVALFILLYILVVGPIDYLFLKKVVKRLELTWVTFPVVVLLISGIAYFVAYQLKGDELKVNKIDVVDIDLHTGQTHGTTLFTLFSPHLKYYTVGVEPTAPEWAAPAGESGPDVFVNWAAAPGSGPGGVMRGGAQSLFRRSYEYAPEASGLLTVPVQVWTTKTFTASWQASSAPGRPVFEARLAPAEANPNVLVGEITSRLPAELTEVALFYRGRYYNELSSLSPGVPVSVAPFNLGGGQGRPLDQWQPAPRAGSTSIAYSLFPLAKPLLFHGADPGRNSGNAMLRPLDQGWRLQDANRDEVVLFARVTPQDAKAEDVTANAATPTRLWLGDLPGSGKQRPPMTGLLAQDTYVRVFLPVTRK